MNTIQLLKKHGMSFEVIAEVGAIPYSVVINIADGADLHKLIATSAHDKLKRLENVLANATPLDNIKSGDFFEKHMLLRPLEDGKTEWVFLYTLWGSGIISDDELAKIVETPILSEVMVAKQFTNGDPDFALEDIVKLREAEPSSYMEYRKTIR